MSDCCVCLEPINSDNPVVWPCGHRICAACDARMRAHQLHTCPTCRTPREGYTTESARNARERQDAPTFFGIHVAADHSTIPISQPSGPALIFFPSEAGGSGPAGILADLERSVREHTASSEAVDSDEPEEPRDGYNALALLLSELTRPNATVESFMGQARNLRRRMQEIRALHEATPEGARSARGHA
ncbi:MAG: hypothetical protein CMK83_00380 [Pseudomonadales bacterium]|nr:hypothetical protein [Pseudomonadales bacterium]